MNLMVINAQMRQKEKVYRVPAQICHHPVVLHDQAFQVTG
jgi:hypothetical protein